MTFGREIYFSTVYSTVYIGNTIFLRKCTVTDKYQKPVPIFVSHSSYKAECSPIFFCSTGVHVRGGCGTEKGGEHRL